MSALPGLKFQFPEIGEKRDNFKGSFKKVWAWCQIDTEFLRNMVFCVCLISILGGAE